MAHNNGIITTTGSGISVTADIAEVLNESSSDVGVLCRSDNINMWSKAKPIKYSSWTDNGGGEEDSDGNPYGIHRPQHDDITQIAEQVIAHVKPTGGSASPYRVLDFDGYNHNCVCPWSIVMPSGNFPVGSNTAVVKFLDAGASVPTGNVSIDDLYDDLYFCVNIGGYYKTLGVGDSTLNISECPAYKYAAAGDVLTILCAMSSRQLGDPTDYTDWANGGVDAMFYSLSYPGHSCKSIITLYTPAQTTRGFVINGLSAADKRLLPLNATTDYNNGYYYNSASQTGRLSKDYTLTSASVQVTLHSTSEVIASETLDTSDCLPTLLERGDGGYPYTVNFSAPVNEFAFNLPPAPYGDNYDIRVILTYS